jgi:glycosyltransferase involved in cell wall biosynthesis
MRITFAIVAQRHGVVSCAAAALDRSMVFLATPMDYPLAVILPEIGFPTATFVRRHACDLLPGRTAFVVRDELPPWVRPSWDVSGPLLDLRRPSRPARWLGRALARAGWSLEQRMVQRFFRRHGVRVALGEFLNSALEWVDAARAAGVQYFAHAHGYDVTGFLRDPQWRVRYLRFNQCAGVVTMSRYSAMRLLEVGLHPDKVHVVPYGVDVPAEPPAHPPGGAVRCLAVGRMEAEKAPILLLDSFRRAAEQHPQLEMDYLGDGRLRPAAQQYVLAHGLGGRVRLLGYQPHHTVLEAMRQADVFLQHSILDPDTGSQEGLPVAILEAMAASLPVVATREAGIPEEVVEGETGYLVEPGDTAGMAERLAALAEDTALRTRLGLAGWHRARQFFTWQQERSHLLRLFGLAG